MNIRQRNAIEADMPYVLSTWVRSYGSRVPSSRRQEAIVQFRRRYVAPVLAADPHIVVLCSPERPSALHGYAISLAGALVWAYVAKDLRRHGLARQAIAAALRDYPDAIPVNAQWPFPSERFRFQKLAA